MSEQLEVYCAVTFNRELPDYLLSTKTRVTLHLIQSRENNACCSSSTTRLLGLVAKIIMLVFIVKPIKYQTKTRVSCLILDRSLILDT